MQICELQNREILDLFVAKCQHGSLLQSWQWGEFQESLGRTVWRVGVYESDELIAVATIIEHTVPLGLSYLYIPYGPLFKDSLSLIQKETATKVLLSELRSVTAVTRTRVEIFSRLEPRILWSEVGNFFINTGLVKTNAVQPQDTQVVDLTFSHDELLASFHHKTRYNIRLAEKKGVTVRQLQAVDEMGIFWELMQKTTDRDGFHAHDEGYYRMLFECFSQNDINDQLQLSVVVLVAEFEDKPIAALMLGLFGETAVYLHGASDHEYRQLMAPQLLQWQAMKIAKEAGYTRYDLWGIKPTVRTLADKSKEHAWEGITRFKKGFGGNEVNFAGAWDFVYEKKLYWLYRLVRRLR